MCTEVCAWRLPDTCKQCAKEGTTIKVVCAWCGISLGEKDGQGAEGISHGICPECVMRHFGKEG